MTGKKKEKTEKEYLKEISEKMDKIIAMIAINGKDTDIQIDILRNLKLEWDEIGAITGLTSEAARKRHSRKK